MELGRQEAASASSVGLVIAAVTVASAFIVAEIMVSPPSTSDSRSSSLDREAALALDLIVNDAGLASDGRSWGVAPDNLIRFGLAQDGSPNFVDYVKVRALRNGTLAAAANGAPDYPEVRNALGVLDADLHLRSYPVLPGLEDPRWSKERHGRIGYVGHYSGAVAAATLTPTQSATSSTLNVSLTIRNDALIPAIFTAAFSPGQQATGNLLVTEERHTRLLAPGETQTVWVRFDKLAEWENVDAIKIDVIDSYGNVAVSSSGVTIGSFWYAQAPPAGNSGANPYNLLVSAAATYYVAGDTVEFVLDHHDGEGDRVNNAKGRFALFGPNGAEWRNLTVDLPGANKAYTFACTNCSTPGTYTGVLWDVALTRKAQDVVHVSPTQLFTEKATLDPVATKEIAILGGLVENFDATKYDATTAPEGDLFGDDSNGPNALIDVIDRYTTLIVGSEVSQTALNAAATKYAIADWVQAGGNLLVLGTNQQQSRWLEPIYHAAQETANGGISAPDPTHAILSAPNKLEYDRYLDRGRAWRIKEGADFTHVLTRGAQSNGDMDDTLAVSEPGVFNNGTVVLTSYMPGSLTSPQDDLEAKKLMHNLMSQGFTMLFLDYGPPIPDGVPVGSASRLVAVPHPNVPGAVVEVRLVLYLFG